MIIDLPVNNVQVHKLPKMSFRSSIVGTVLEATCGKKDSTTGRLVIGFLSRPNFSMSRVPILRRCYQEHLLRFIAVSASTENIYYVDRTFELNLYVANNNGTLVFIQCVVSLHQPLDPEELTELN